jgi:hypothetical protein
VTVAPRSDRRNPARILPGAPGSVQHRAQTLAFRHRTGRTHHGLVTKIETSVGNKAVPAGGYVLSGHGDSNTWLKTNAKVGSRMTLS